MCYPAEFGCSMSDGMSVIKEIRLKDIDPSRSPFKVTGTDTDRNQRPVTSC